MNSDDKSFKVDAKVVIDGGGPREERGEIG